MLQISVPDPDKYTDVEIGHFQPERHYAKGFGNRVLIGVFSVVNTESVYNPQKREHENVTREAIYAITARLTSDVLTAGFARIENHDKELGAYKAKEFALRSEIEVALSEAKKGLAATVKVRDEAILAANQLRNTLTDERQLYQGTEERARKLEGDLAKVKMYFGEKDYAEALAGKPGKGG